MSALDFVGPRNDRRFPTYVRVDLGVEHRFKFGKYRPWIGVRVDNALNSFLPADVQANITSPAFGTFYNSDTASSGSRSASNASAPTSARAFHRLTQQRPTSSRVAVPDPRRARRRLRRHRHQPAVRPARVLLRHARHPGDARQRARRALADLLVAHRHRLDQVPAVRHARRQRRRRRHPRAGRARAVDRAAKRRTRALVRSACSAPRCSTATA